MCVNVAFSAQNISELRCALGAHLQKLENQPYICSGSVDNSKFELYTGPETGLRIQIDTRCCNFSSTPTYLTSLTGFSTHWYAVGVSSAYYASQGGFNVYLTYFDTRVTKQAMLSMAARYNWALEWVGIEKKP